MLSGVLCRKMCTEFQSWVWRISKTKCVPAGPVTLDQQLINKAIDQWRQTLKPVVKVHEGTLNSCLLDCLVCIKFSLFYLDIHASTHFQLCFTIVIQYSLGALILWHYLLITL